MPGPTWPAATPKRPNIRARVVSGLSGLVLVALSGFAVKLGIERTLQHEPSRPTRAVDTHPVYTQRAVRIHSAPWGDSAVTRTLPPGERILVTERDNRNWVEVFESDGDQIGFAYEANGNLGPKPPPVSQFMLLPLPRSASQDPQRHGDTDTAFRTRAEYSPADTTAICRDGWISRSQHRSGTCSSHGGILIWVKKPPR